jgi:hypothetical protein
MTANSDLPEDLFFAQAKEIEIVLRRAAHQALLMHKHAGNPIASWRDGKVVIAQPDEIQVDDPLDKKSNL